MKSILLIAASLAALVMAGCDPVGLEQAARIAGAKLDENTARVVRAFLEGVEKAAAESTEWRDLVDGLRRDLKALPPGIRVEAMALTDFLLARAKENADELSSITGLLAKKDYARAYTAFTALQRGVQGKFPPRVGTAVPAAIEVAWVDHLTPRKKDPKLTTVQFVGFNFDPTARKDLGLEVRDAGGRKTRTGWDHLTVTSPYLAQVDVSGGSGLAFRPGEVCLVLTHRGKDLASVPVVWAPRPEPPPPAPKIVNVEAVMHTGSHKEAGGQVELSWHHQGRKLADSLHRKTLHLLFIGAHHVDAHPGAYETWEKGHTARFSPPGGAAFRPDYKAGEELRVDIALGAVPGERNINWRGNITFHVLLDDGRKVEVGHSGGFWFRNNVVEDPPHLRGNRSITVRFALPPLPPK